MKIRRINSFSITIPFLVFIQIYILSVLGTLSGAGLYLIVYPDVNFTRSIVSKRHREMEWGNREAKNLNFEILSWHAALINFITLRGGNDSGHCIHYYCYSSALWPSPILAIPITRYWRLTSTTLLGNCWWFVYSWFN